MNMKEFITVLILNAPIAPAEVKLRFKHEPRQPSNPRYMRGWHAVGDRVRRKQ